MVIGGKKSYSSREVDIASHSVKKGKFNGDNGIWPWNWTWRMSWTSTDKIKELGIFGGWELHEKHVSRNKAE